MIESLGNTKIKHAGKLKQKKYRSETGEFLVEGYHLVEEACKSGFAKLVLTTEPLEFSGTETETITNQVMRKISELGEEKGYIAICRKPLPGQLSNKILLLDGVQDPGNMGTLIRTAAAFGFGTIVSENSVDFYNEKVIRASQGAIFHVDLVETNLSGFIKAHREYRYYGTIVASGKDIRTIEFTEHPVGIILGNEGSGVRREIAELADINITIPMDQTESLNVGIAGAIIMYETYRRK